LGGTLLISDAQHAANKRTQLRVGDLLLTTVGTIGNAAVVGDDIVPANADRHLGIIRLNADSGLDPYYVSTFLNCRFGRFQTLRESTGNVQLNLFIEKMKELRVPRLGVANEVAVSTREAYRIRARGLELYAEAESRLSSTLGLGELDLAPDLCYDLMFGDAVEADRFDAEYYQPAKWRVVEALRNIPGRLVADNYHRVRALFQPERARGEEVVRNYDLSDALVPFLDDSVEPVMVAGIGSTKIRLQAGDLVVSRLRSYLKEMAVVLPSGPEPLVGSTEFIVLRPRPGAISPEVVLVYLRSPYVQTVLRWCQDGSNHPRFDEKELLRLPIPSVVELVQNEVGGLVRKAIECRRQAGALLDQAKAMVETAIVEHP
jgi:type I restriction enzyme S subunit